MMQTLGSVLAAANPVDHVVIHPWLISENGVWLWSNQATTLVLSGIVLLLLGPWVASKVATGSESQGHERYVTKGRFAHMIEVICVYLREQTVRPLLHERTDRFMPFLWTLFFFILVNNLLGLIPMQDLFSLWDHLFNGAEYTSQHRALFGGTPTQNLAVTGMLAVIAFFVINIAGIRELGLGGYLKHLTGGAPVFIWPLMILVEFVGMFIKPIALAIRLFANMTAGHILLATLFMFTGMSFAAGLSAFVPITLVSALGAVAIYFLEIFVAFLQAFIFMFLTTVFISQLAHHEHEHADEHAKGAEPVLAH